MKLTARRAAFAARNPVATAGVGMVGGPLYLMWAMVKWTAIFSWYMVKWSAIILFLMGAGIYVLVSKGAPAAGDLLRRSRHQFHVGTGEITEGDARDLDALAAEKPLQPGVWYLGHGVIPKK